MTQAGWYDDPLIPGGQRYWDGQQWTDHVQPPREPALAESAPSPPHPPALPPPPRAGDQPAGAQGPPFTSGVSGSHPPRRFDNGKINNIGDWLGRSFSGIFERFVPLSIFLAIPLAIGAVAYLASDLGLRGASVTESGDFVGYNLPLLVLAGVLLLVALLASIPAYLAANHNLYGAHVGKPPSARESFRAGVSGSPRFIGISLALILAFVLVVGFVIAMAFGLGAAGVDGGLQTLLVVVAVIGGICLGYWLWVKLTFVAVAAAVLPAGMSVVQAAWDATEGYFWPIFGRKFLLTFLVNVVSRIFETIASTILAGLLLTRFEFGPDDSILVDGVPLESLRMIEIADLLPNPIAAIVAFGAFIYALTIMYWTTTSGVAALYADTGAPNTFDHVRGQ